MDSLVNSAIAKVRSARLSFCRFITANDTGDTGAHQAGFYIPKCAARLLFETPGQKGENKSRTVHICWQNDITTESRFIYYGRGTRNEYRITRFGRNFPFFQESATGDLLIVAQESEDDYAAFVLSSDQDIEDFLAHFNLDIGSLNRLIDTSASLEGKDILDETVRHIVDKFEDFPPTTELGSLARECYNTAFHIKADQLCSSPDTILMHWFNTEYKLFRNFEDKFYRDAYQRPFSCCQDLIDFANSILNRRKSRAGKSLEHHLATIFSANRLHYEQQIVTEGNKRPDFIFPSGKAYHDIVFPTKDLVFLGAKTTCKDRWRQILNEANRIKDKYLFTLQQGISKNQLSEMKSEHVTLVVPEAYRQSFPEEFRADIKSLSSFIGFVKSTQA